MRAGDEVTIILTYALDDTLRPSARELPSEFDWTCNPGDPPSVSPCVRIPPLEFTYRRRINVRPTASQSNSTDGDGAQSPAGDAPASVCTRCDYCWTLSSAEPRHELCVLPPSEWRALELCLLTAVLSVIGVALVALENALEHHLQLGRWGSTSAP